MASDLSDRAIAAYETQAGVLRSRYDAVTTDDVLSGVVDILPKPPVHVLDVGAGSGRDTAWFATRGDRVTAAEPVSAFRAAIEARVPGAAVVDARLPDLDGIAGPFGLILVNAVWQHLTAGARVAAVARIAALLAPGGQLILSLRHGPVPEGQPVLALDPDEEIARAVAAGLELRRRVAAPSHQPQNIAAGVTWTWLVFEKDMQK